jgi:hypothetical protein
MTAAKIIIVCHCRFCDHSFDVSIEPGFIGLDRKKPSSQLENYSGDTKMRFMMIVRHAEKQGPPPKELMDAIAKLVEEEAKAGTMLGTGGLGPTALGARVRLSGGQVTVTDGPFTETKEVIGGYAQFELKSKEEAIESAVRFMELHKQHWPGWEGETEVREMFVMEDFVPKI